MLVNDGLEPDTAEIVTLASLLDKGVLPLKPSNVCVVDCYISISGRVDGDGAGESERSCTASKQWSRGNSR